MKAYTRLVRLGAVVVIISNLAIWYEIYSGRLVLSRPEQLLYPLTVAAAALGWIFSSLARNR